MSLINEALKKAQRQRTLESAPLARAPSGVAAAAVTTHVRAASHRRSLAPLWFGLGLLALGAGATALVMHYGFAPAGAPRLAAAAPSANPPPAAPADASATAAPVRAPEVAPLPAITLPPLGPPPPAAVPAEAAVPAASTPAPRPEPVVAPAPVSAPAKPAKTTPAPVAVQTAPAPTPVAPVAAPPDLAPRIQTFLAEARVAGVRGQAAQARVLMNEKVFRLNDVVDRELGLKLTGVLPGLLVFTDARGRTYEKNF